ncbi:hypothetical protein [Clostridium sp.]|uniref:hypothetical protein n=1 Tax=Clostridium sp. TaxID=1506 RepID=UPI001A394FF9|nr:hypothetical protein [Clostridium sp.]MBK5235722.1 hypothetical protein [Clostridium sp.]
MGTLYICNEKMQRSYMIEAIFNKIYTINCIDPYVKHVSIDSKKNDVLMNNIFLLLDKIKKIVALK